MKKQHIANFVVRPTRNANEITTLCGRVEGVKRIAWGFYGTIPLNNICRTCLSIDGANNDPYKYASRRARG
jgi:hypothetical protein